MKVNSPDMHAQARTGQSQKNAAASGPSKEEARAKIEEKFGVKLGEKKEKEPDVVVSINKKGEKKVEEGSFGDIKNNDPASEVTQEKLKGLLASGGFHFNDKERAALSQILDK
ncbi:MAG: hypothetical protein WD025_03030 [Bacteriovoracaceae bacterium]